MKQFRGTALLVFLVLQAAGAGAQDFRAAYPGTGSVTMSGEWRFHTSDDPKWADPSLDDTGWETIAADGTWGSQTHPGHVGFAWYRRKVEISGVTGPLSIAMPGVNDAYELYWNGLMFAGQGKLPPNATWRPVSVPEVFPLPSPGTDGVLKGELAIRVWKAPLDSLSSVDVGGLEGPPRIGDSKVLNEQRRLGMALRQQRSLPNILECAFMFVIGISSLAIWARDRRNRLFLWLALFLLSASGYIAFAFPAFLQWQTLATYQTYIQTISVVADISIWMLVMTVFGLDQERRWRLTTYCLVALDLAAQLGDTAALLFWEHAGPGLQWLDGATTAVYSVLPMYLFVLLIAGLRRRRDVALLPIALACVGLEVFSLINGALGQGKRFTHIDFQALLQKAALHLGPDYILGVRGQVTAIMLVVTVWTVFRQQAIERKQQLLLAAEVKSAKEVQQVLVPEEMEPVPGFAIGTLYWPAEEVGGDLFQVLPGKDGDVLVVLADVSGKGLRAAMTVSLMVGALRTLAEHTTDPTEILAGLNRRLVGRTDGGFATCVALHVQIDGQVRMANAGHLAPFINGVEMSATGSLPLGLASKAEFEASRFLLHEGDEVALYTDGVLEAQRKDGELFGFERCTELMRSRPSVQTIAEAAKKFGQMDDITVLKITRIHADDARERMSVDLRTVAG